jgi:hypothetical protein
MGSAVAAGVERRRHQDYTKKRKTKFSNVRTGVCVKLLWNGFRRVLELFKESRSDCQEVDSCKGFDLARLQGRRSISESNVIG